LSDGEFDERPSTSAKKSKSSSAEEAEEEEEDDDEEEEDDHEEEDDDEEEEDEGEGASAAEGCWASRSSAWTDSTAASLPRTRMVPAADDEDEADDELCSSGGNMYVPFVIVANAAEGCASH
jgi:hypothetical protein